MAPKEVDRMDALHEKKEKLKSILRGLESVAVAFSAGVDSTFLLAVAREALGERAFAVTADTGTFPRRELDEAAPFCREQNVRLITPAVDVFSVEGFCDNTPERCYVCKKALFSRIIDEARRNGARYVVEGSNVDDEGDFRPGMRAIAELGVRSPLREAGLTKAEIRALSKELGLGTWDKPSFACLATRIAYGETITPEKLAMIEKAEKKLADLGFVQYRVRVRGSEARVELLPEDIDRALSPELRKDVSEYLHALGFRHVSLDLDGYRTGSMNETLK